MVLKTKLKSFKKSAEITYNGSNLIVPLTISVSDELYYAANHSKGIDTVIKQIFDSLKKQKKEGLIKIFGDEQKELNILLAEIEKPSYAPNLLIGNGGYSINLERWLKEKDRLGIAGILLSHPLPEGSPTDLCLRNTQLIYNVEGVKEWIVKDPNSFKCWYKC